MLGTILLPRLRNSRTTIKSRPRPQRTRTAIEVFSVHRSLARTIVASLPPGAPTSFGAARHRGPKARPLLRWLSSDEDSSTSTVALPDLGGGVTPTSKIPALLRAPVGCLTGISMIPRRCSIFDYSPDPGPVLPPVPEMTRRLSRPCP